jgi:hypothetical protein
MKRRTDRCNRKGTFYSLLKEMSVAMTHKILYLRVYHHFKL